MRVCSRNHVFLLFWFLCVDLYLLCNKWHHYSFLSPSARCGRVSMNSSLEQLADVLYGGIDPNIPGHGGPVCAAYLPPRLMILETLISTSMMIIVGVLGYKTYTMPSSFPAVDNHPGKRVLLALLCLVFGLELGYKICSRQVLYLLNPCHVITVVEVGVVQPSC